MSKILDSGDFDDGKTALQSMRSTGASNVFRVVSRDVRPSWANRLIKDFHNPESDGYDLKGKTFCKRFQRNKSKESLEKEKYPRRKKRPVVNKINMKHPILAAESIELGREYSPEALQEGLSPFEYRNTINGRFASRKNHHISFEKNKVGRSINLNPVYYQRDEDIDLELVNLRKQRLELDKFHRFSSYTTRRVFEGALELDKMFDTLQCYKLCTPQSIKQKIVPFETVPGRKNDPIKESTLVSYEVSAGLAHVFPKTASASLRRSARELQFTREIISQKRGCYR